MHLSWPRRIGRNGTNILSTCHCHPVVDCHPSSCERDVLPRFLARRYSLGYRHMIRWYVVGLWEVLDRMGYQYVMRMDEDSRILSAIPFDIFSLMAARGYQ